MKEAYEITLMSVRLCVPFLVVSVYYETILLYLSVHLLFCFHFLCCLCCQRKSEGYFFPEFLDICLIYDDAAINLNQDLQPSNYRMNNE